jgi:hypothetical protein
LYRFHEQLITTKKNVLYKVLTIYMGISIIMSLLTLFGGGLELAAVFMVIIYIASFFVARFLKNRQYKEYEYVFTDGTLEIDIIINKKKRRNLFEINVAGLEDFGKCEEIIIPKGVKRVVCFPWNSQENKYIMLFKSRLVYAIFITPDDELLRLLSIYKKGKIK